MTAALPQHGIIIAPRKSLKARSGQLVVKHEFLGCHLVHGDARSQDPAAGIRDAENLQQTLYRPILAIAPMQGDKGHLDTFPNQARGQVAAGIDTHRQVTGLLQGVQDRTARAQRNLPFG